MLNRYQAFGLNVLSEIPIPGALPAHDARHTQLHISWGEAEPGEIVRREGPYALGSRGLLFEKASVARYLVALNGESISIQRHAGASVAEVSAFLIATAMPVALWLRGDMALHAAAVVLRGERGAIGIMGASGAGKSSMMHALVGEGNAMVAEDVVRIRFETGTFLVSGLPQCLWLRRAGTALEADRECLDVPNERCREEAPLCAIVVLGEQSPEATASMTRLGGIASMKALLRNRHRPLVASLLDLENLHLGVWAELAKSVPVYMWNSQELLPQKFCEALRLLP